jgi:hypothetical protein
MLISIQSSARLSLSRQYVTDLSRNVSIFGLHAALKPRDVTLSFLEVPYPNSLLFTLHLIEHPTQQYGAHATLLLWLSHFTSSTWSPTSKGMRLFAPWYVN